MRRDVGDKDEMQVLHRTPFACTILPKRTGSATQPINRFCRPNCFDGMRIVQTATAYYPSVGGAQLHWFTIARLLRARAHEVAAIAQWTDERSRYLLDSTLFAPWGDDRYDADGIPVYRFQPSLVARCWMAPLLPACFVLPEVCYPPISAYFARLFERIPGR